MEAGILNHGLDRRDRQRGARTEPGRGNTGREAAFVRKPLQSVADAGAIDAAGADACDDHTEVIAVQRGRFRVDDPTDRAQDAAQENHEARTVFVDEPAFDRHQPGLEEHKQRESPLDIGAGPSEFLLDVGDEEGPAILVVGDHHHRGDANGQLRPAICVAHPRGCGRRSMDCIRHRFFPRGALLFLVERCCPAHLGVRYATVQAITGDRDQMSQMPREATYDDDCAKKNGPAKRGQVSGGNVKFEPAADRCDSSTKG